MTISAEAERHDDFYKNEKRARSRELDFGVWWKKGGSMNTYRVTWIEATGEVYIVDMQKGEYKVIGVIHGEEQVENALKGWADECGGRDSLSWVLNRLSLYVR